MNVVIVVTEEERKALLAGLAWVNAYFGKPPDPPTPGMTVRTKLEQADMSLREEVMPYSQIGPPPEQGDAGWNDPFRRYVTPWERV